MVLRVKNREQIIIILIIRIIIIIIIIIILVPRRDRDRRIGDEIKRILEEAYNFDTS